MRKSLNVSVKEIMIEDVICADVTTPLKDAAQLITEKRIGCLIVQKRNKPVGIITERDFVKLFQKPRSRMKNGKVKDIMVSPLISVNSTTRFTDAFHILNKHDIKRVPVITRGKIQGLVTLSVMLNYSRYIYLDMLERNQKLEKAIQRDALTGLYNKKYFLERAREEFGRIQRYGGRSSLLFLDIDHFKHVNDTYSHQAGDYILKKVGALLKQYSRTTDIVARYGGEEFVAISPLTKTRQAVEYAEKLREKIADTIFTYKNKKIHITISIGIADFSGGTTLTSVIGHADAALYKAKRTGRNRVCLWRK